MQKIREEIVRLYEITMEPGFKPAAELLSKFSNHEIKQLELNLIRQQEKWKEEEEEETPEEQLEERLETWTNTFEFFLGDLTEAQNELLKKQLKAWPKDPEMQWLKFRVSQQTKLIQLMKEEKGVSALETFITDWGIRASQLRTPSHRAHLEKVRASMVDTVTEILRIATTEQRARVVETLQKLEADFTELSQD